MSANTGIGLPGESSGGGGGGGSDLSALSDYQIPRYNSATKTLVNSGFRISETTAALQGSTTIETLADIQSGVSTFRLGRAHTITSAAENVTFRNIITDTVFHPTWQSTQRNGTWSSVQRTPVGDLVQDFVFQADRSETVTNPSFTFTSLAFDHRLYEIQIEPIAAVDNVIVVIQQRNPAGDFVDYWRSRLINLTASQLATPTPQNIAINPFIDLQASTEYQLIAVAPNDIQVRGNAAGVPRILLTYRRWQDLPLATLAEATVSRLVMGERLVNNGSFLSIGDVLTNQNTSGVIFGQAVTLIRLDWDRFPTFNSGVIRVYVDGVSRQDLTIGSTQTGNFIVTTPVSIPAGSRISMQWRTTFGPLFNFIATFTFR